MFDPSAPHIIVLLIVVLLLFGSRRLPGAAKSLGESMHIFKKSIHGLDDEGQPADQAASATSAQAAAAPQAAIQPAPVPSTFTPSYDAVSQQQIADLQRQIADLQRQNPGQDSMPGGAAAPAPEAQHSQQPF
jgi:sec-independent protein translocase protein TatA